MAIQQGPVLAAGPATQRDPADVLAGRIRLILAGDEYVLPVLTIGENEEWQAELEEGLQPLLAAGDDIEDVIAALGQFSGRMMDFIRSYDKTGVIPEAGPWEKQIYPYELLKAVMEVRLAADPTLGYVLADLSRQAARERTLADRKSPTTTGRGPSSRGRTAGRSRKPGRR